MSSIRSGSAAPVLSSPDSSAPMKSVPLSETPLSETPLTDTPLSETPLTDTPLSETPLNDTPLSETPLSETPLSDTPLNDTPLSDTPLSPVTAWSAPFVVGSVAAVQPVNARAGTSKLFRTTLMKTLLDSAQRVGRAGPPCSEGVAYPGRQDDAAAGPCDARAR